MEKKEKINKVIAYMTLEEKVSMIHGAGLFRTGAVERLAIPPLKMSDGPMGVRNEFCNDRWIPNGNSDDYVTYCPSNSAIAAAWNRELAGACGSVLGEEARGRGKDVILAPGINIKRVPVCGRNFEYFSEDPYLTAELAVPMVEGIEEHDVAACVKHFALNNQETERLFVNVEIEERALREIYLPAFEAVILKAKARSIMSAYNLYQGRHCSCNKTLLMDILRREWSYDGVVISDWGGVHDTEQTAKGALDIEMSVTPDFDAYFLAAPLVQAVKEGRVPESCIDEKIYHILQLMIRLHMIEIEELPDGTVKVINPENRKDGAYNTREHREKVLEAARESIVLLKNENMRLPLRKKGLKQILVIGDNAARLQAAGGGSAEIKALYEITPLMGIKKLLGGNCQVEYAPGYYVPPKEEQDTNWQEDSLKEQDRKAHQEQKSGQRKAMEEKLRKEATALAAGYDEVIYVGGLNHDYDVEGMDRKDLKLPYEQDRLIQELLKIRPDMVIVMMAGSPVSMGEWLPDARALLWCSYCGMEGGTALAEIIFGQVNPSGKLAESLPYKFSDCGITRESQFPGRKLKEKEKKKMNAHLIQEYEEGVFVGYRYYEKYRIPLQFCFGYGLSYSSFHYDDFVVMEKTDEDITLGITVSNTGSRSGKEVVELYVGEEIPSEDNPVKELKGFDKIFLEAGEKKHVTFHLKKKDFAHYDSTKKNFVTKSGTYKIYAGSSLEDIKQSLITEW